MNDSTVKPRQICLVGLRCSGKSAVGKALAGLLGWPLYDTDTELTRMHGSIASQFARDGELEFRRREQAVLAECLGRYPLVLSTGGGAVLLAENRALLAGRHTVWLQAPPIELARRLMADPVTAGQRPPLLPGTMAEADTGVSCRRWELEMERLLLEREPLYAEVARLRIDTGSQSPLAAAAIIARDLVTSIGNQP
ncbi:MAG: shikimate kinase [Planctomycetota bacterium]|nr:shikimate kinase [Planctomycetota bacterium]